MGEKGFNKKNAGENLEHLRGGFDALLDLIKGLVNRVDALEVGEGSRNGCLCEFNDRLQKVDDKYGGLQLYIEQFRQDHNKVVSGINALRGRLRALEARHRAVVAPKRGTKKRS